MANPNKPKNDKGDWMSKQMDEQLEQIEDRLSALYANASFEVNKEWAKFKDTFAEEDAKRLALVESGQMPFDRYINWRRDVEIQSNQYQRTVDSMTNILVNTDVASMAIVDGELPSVVANSYNFVQALGFESVKPEEYSIGTFQVYNAKSIETILKQNEELLPKVDIEEDRRWNQTKISNEIMSSILKGESMDKTAERLQKVTDMDKNSAIRNARTAMTGAENLGRSESAKDLKEKGIPLQEEWVATHDDRTRETHLLLDGTFKDENGVYGADILLHPLRFPADPLGDAQEIYNCRCRESIRLEGVDHSNDDKLYEEFMKENFPDDWKALQNKSDYEKASDAKYATNKQKAEENRPKYEERVRQALEENRVNDLVNSPKTEESQKPEKEGIPAKPTRPKRDDFELPDGSFDYEGYEQARDNFQKEKEAYEAKKEAFIQEAVNGKSMSVEDFTAWCNKNNVGIIEGGTIDPKYKGEMGDISNVDGRLLQKITDRYEELLERFPAVADFREREVNWFINQGLSSKEDYPETAFKFCIGYAKDEPYFNAEASRGFVFGANATVEAWAESYFEQVSTGFLSEGLGSLEAVFDHEFGHNVKFAIEFDIQQRGGSKADFINDITARLLKAEGSSEYSSTNDDELFAEAFNAYVGGEDTPFAHEMEKILKEHKMI